MIVEIADEGTQRVIHTAENVPIKLAMYNDTLSFEIIKMPETNIILGKS